MRILNLFSKRYQNGYMCEKISRGASCLLDFIKPLVAQIYYLWIFIGHRVIHWNSR